MSGPLRVQATKSRITPNRRPDGRRPDADERLKRRLDERPERRPNERKPNGGPNSWDVPTRLLRS